MHCIPSQPSAQVCASARVPMPGIFSNHSSPEGIVTRPAQPRRFSKITKWMPLRASRVHQFPRWRSRQWSGGWRGRRACWLLACGRWSGLLPRWPAFGRGRGCACLGVGYLPGCTDLRETDHVTAHRLFSWLRGMAGCALGLALFPAFCSRTPLIFLVIFVSDPLGLALGGCTTPINTISLHMQCRTPKCEPGCFGEINHLEDQWVIPPKPPKRVRTRKRASAHPMAVFGHFLIQPGCNHKM